MLKSERVSESMRLGTILMFSGGFLDAYSYLMRGNVFATAETGNIVLMGINLAQGNYSAVGRYLVPVVSYAAGIFAAEWIRKSLGEKRAIHWKEGVLWLELLVFFLAGWIPGRWNPFVNCMIGFTCAMQVEAFRKMHGMAFATTMCTGNLRSGTELLSVGIMEKNREQSKKGLSYYWIDFTFIIGAAVSTLACGIFKEKAIWLCGLSTLAAILFIRHHKKYMEV